MAKRFKIKTFLILSFVWILLFMVILGGFSIYNIRKLANQTATFYDQPHTIQVEVAEIRRVMGDIGSLMRRAIIYQTPESDKYSQDAIAEDVQEMGERINLVKERFTGDTQLLTAADETVELWLAEIDKLNDMMDKNQYEDAIKEFSGTYQELEKDVNENVTRISQLSEEESQDFYKQAQQSEKISLGAICGIVLLTILLSIIICISILKGIVIPLKMVRAAAEAMSEGNLRYPLEYQANNEFGELVKSIRETQQTLGKYIDNIDYVLERMSQNDLTVRLEMEYVGEFKSIRTSEKKILVAMNYFMTQMKDTADTIDASASQVAGSAQILSQGSVEQSASVQQLSDNVRDVNMQVRQNADYTEQTKELVNAVGAELSKGNEQMQDMLKAMSAINESSSQIAKIIKTIEDIAFQTNILALNAAIEAARAGEAGKGFAVVADEVRNLAGKSAEAAKNTTDLIQNSIEAVSNGTQIADDTAATLGSVVMRAQDITQMVNKITESSEQQAEYLNQINTVVGEISQVIQTNSASAEESAATSEEMSGQAGVMKELVGKFKLLPMEESLKTADEEAIPDIVKLTGQCGP